MRVVRHVETRARRDQHVLVFEQVHRKTPVVEPRQFPGIDADEAIERAHRRRDGQVPAARHRFEDGLARFVQPSARAHQLADALVAAERRLHGPLAGDVAAQAQRREQFETGEVLARVLQVAGKRGPADAVAAGAIHLRQPAHRAAERVVHQRRHRHELGAVIRHLVVDLVREHDQVVLLGDARDALEHCPRIHRASRVVRVDHDDRARALGDQGLHLLRVGHEAALGPARVMHRPAPVQVHGSGPERVVRARHEHFFVGGEQRPQRQVDQLADAVADEHLVGRHAADAALLLLHHDGFARRENALLVAIAFGGAQVLDHRQPHRLGRAEAEGPGIADVQRDDVVAHALHFQGATGELAADLVTDVGEARARADGSSGHGRGRKRRTARL